MSIGYPKADMNALSSTKKSSRQGLGKRSAMHNKGLESDFGKRCALPPLLSPAVSFPQSATFYSKEHFTGHGRRASATPDSYHIGWLK